MTNLKLNLTRGSHPLMNSPEFSQRVSDCLGTVGWPFTSILSIGVLLNRIFRLANQPVSQLLSLSLMWDLAFSSDQWSLQTIVAGIIFSNRVPVSIQVSFAEHILTNSASYIGKLLERSSLAAVPSEPIRNALIIKEREVESSFET